MRSLVVKVLALAAMSSSAYAADDHLRGSIPSQAASYDWTGIYVGAGVRYGDFKDRDLLVPAFVSSGDNINGTVFAGYNYQYGNLVFGIEADYTKMDADFEITQIPAVVDDLYSLRGRVGLAMDRAMVYGTAGISYTSVTATYPLGIGNVELSDIGYVFGLGIDYAITDNIIVGLQYQHQIYNNFGEDDYPAALAPLQGIDADFDVIEARVSYKF